MQKWIDWNYQVGYEWKKEHLIEFIIDTFLDEDARTKVEPYANIAASVSSKVVNKNEDEYVCDVEDEDIEKVTFRVLQVDVLKMDVPCFGDARTLINLLVMM